MKQSSTFTKPQQSVKYLNHHHPMLSNHKQKQRKTQLSSAKNHHTNNFLNIFAQKHANDFDTPQASVGISQKPCTSGSQAKLLEITNYNALKKPI